MNLGFNIRTVFAWMMILFLVVVPRILFHFGLRHQYLLDLTSLWVTFLIILVAEILLLWKWIKNIRIAVFAIILAIVIACGLTSYYAI